MLTEIIKKAIQHKGCSIVDISQLCPTYNKECNPEWFNNNIIKIDSLKNYSNKSIDDANDLVKDMAKTKKIYTGIIYMNDSVPTFYDNLDSRKGIISEISEEVKEYNIKDLLKYCN